MSRKLQPKKSKFAHEQLLNPTQNMFVKQILMDPTFNAAEAARKAGYASPNSSARKLLSNKVVQALIGKELKARMTRCDLKADDVLDHLKNALFLDPLDLFERTADGGYLVKDLASVPKETRRCITKIKTRTRTIHEGGEDAEPTVEVYMEIELMSKDALMPLAMKHLGMLNDKIKIEQDEATQNANNALAALMFKMLEDADKHENVIDGKFIESKV